MPIFQPGDWIKHRNATTRYRVLYIHPNGRLVVEDLSGKTRILTRPEEYQAHTARRPKANALSSPT